VKAVVFRGPSRPLEVEDIEVDHPGPREVRVSVAAAGVCRSDLHVRLGEWDRRTPLVMGHEGAGVVTELGPDVQGLQLGDHVVLNWQPACGRCPLCVQGLPQHCELVGNVVGTRGVLMDGTSRLHVSGETLFHYSAVSSFAEEAIVPESGAVRIRQDLPLDCAALIGCCVSTGVGAVLRTAEVRAGASVVVIGCGAVGLSAVQGARIAGATSILAVDLLATKLRLAREMGATDVVDATDGDAVMSIRDLTKGGADFVFDCIGLPLTISQALAMLGVRGCATIVGMPPYGVKACFDPLPLVEREQRVIGSNYGSVRPPVDFGFLADLYAAKRLDIDGLISHRRQLLEVDTAFEDLLSGRGVRTVLLPNGLAPLAGEGGRLDRGWS